MKIDGGGAIAFDHVWRVDPEDVCIAQHRVLGQPLMPLAYVVVRAARLSSANAARQWFTMENFSALGSVAVANPLDVRVEAKWRQRDLFLRFCVEGITKFTGAVVSGDMAGPDETPPAVVEAEAVYNREQVYRRYAGLGFMYGPAFQRIEAIAVSGKRAWAIIDGRGLPEGDTGDVLVWDNVLQSLIGTQMSVASAEEDTYLPVIVSRIHAMSVFPRCSKFAVWVTLTDIKPQTRVIRLNAIVFSDTGACIAALKGISLKKV